MADTAEPGASGTMGHEQPTSSERRRFLKGGGLAGVAALTAAPLAQAAAAPATATSAKVLPRPDEALESGPPEDPVIQSSCGSDYMVDVIKSLGLEYITTNPASSFRGLHEALVNYGGNSAPELLTCTHEEIAVAMGHGYAKIEGKPLAMMVHGTVGLQHATMAMYNAYCDRAPVIVLGGNTLSAEVRQRAEWVHSAQDPGAMVRDFVKWDDQPHSLRSLGESMVRAYQIAMTPPMGPVLLSIDTELQENELPGDEKPRVPKLAKLATPQAETGALEQVAEWLAKAENPVLIADRLVRSQEGMDQLVALAEVLQCAVIDRNGRTNFPSHHPLNQTFRSAALIGSADVIVALEVNDLFASLNSAVDRIHRRASARFRAQAKIVTIGAKDLFIKANFQDFGRFQEVDLAIAADGQTTLPALTEAVRRKIDASQRSVREARREKLAQAQRESLDQMRERATIGWDSSPITTARLAAELWDQIRNDDWSLVGEGLMPGWRRLWPADKVYRFNGGSGGWGLGYFAPAALGAALANRKHGRLSVAFQGDGDLMFAPGTLWTAAHHRIPILYLMYNNRAYHQEVMYVQSMANRMSRGIDRAHIGTALDAPNIDYAMMARAFGVHAEGPIDNPRDLRGALKRALAVVRRGEPALVDAIVEPR